MRKLLIIVTSILFLSCSETDRQNLQAISTTLEQIGGTQIKKSPRTIKNSSQKSLKSISSKISQAIKPQDQIVRMMAVEMASRYPGNYNIGQVCSIWYHVKENWHYVNDPRGVEYFAPADETLLVGGGDCDDFAILLSSLIEAIGGRTRIILTNHHAYCEVHIGNNQKDIDKIIENIIQLDLLSRHQKEQIKFKQIFHWHSNKDGHWLNLDWSADYPGGPFSPADQLIAIYPNGKVVIGPEKVF